MSISVFDIFKIGIGPSSSHTVGPMVAARRFLESLEADGLLEKTAHVTVQLFGSLALTGKGHGTDKAVLLGLSGETPREVDPDKVDGLLAAIRETGRIRLLGRHEIGFDEPMDLLMHRDRLLPEHPNGMRFSALDANDRILMQAELYSVGGGFVRAAGESDTEAEPEKQPVPYPFESARDLLHLGDVNGMAIHELVMANELVWRDRQAVRAGLKDIWDAMPAHHQAIMKVGMQALALKNATINEVKNAQTKKDLLEKGVTISEWSQEDLATYRDAVQKAWVEFATTPESKKLLESHISFLQDLGAMK